MGKEYGPFVANELMKIDVTVGSLCLEIRSFIRSVRCRHKDNELECTCQLIQALI